MTRSRRGSGAYCGRRLPGGARSARPARGSSAASRVGLGEAEHARGRLSSRPPVPGSRSCRSAAAAARRSPRTSKPGPVHAAAGRPARRRDRRAGRRRRRPRSRHAPGRRPATAATGPCADEHPLDVVEVDPDAEHLADPLEPAGEEQVTLVVEVAEVAGAQHGRPAHRRGPGRRPPRRSPSSRWGRGRRPRRTPARRSRRPRAGSGRRPPGTPADRAELVGEPLRRQRGHPRGGLGLAVHDEHAGRRRASIRSRKSSTSSGRSRPPAWVRVRSCGYLAGSKRSRRSISYWYGTAASEVTRCAVDGRPEVALQARRRRSSDHGRAGGAGGC